MQGPIGPKGDKGDTASGLKDIIATSLGILTVLQADNGQHDVDIITSDSFFGTLTASGWTGSAAPYTQTITVNGILATDTPIVDLNMAEVTDANSSQVLEEWSCIGRLTVSNDNEITAYCYEEKPTIDIPVLFKIIR